MVLESEAKKEFLYYFTLFFPLAYYYNTRDKLLSLWPIFDFSLPVFAYFIIFNTSVLVQGLLLLMMMLLVYEAGYIHNDNIASLKEKSPKKRLSYLYPINLSYFGISLRFVIVILIFLLMFSGNIAILIYLVGLFAVFLLHNLVYKVKPATYFLLRLLKYLFVGLFLITGEYLLLLIFVFFARAIFEDILYMFNKSIIKYTSSTYNSILSGLYVFLILIATIVSVIINIVNASFNYYNLLIIASAIILIHILRIFMKRISINMVDKTLLDIRELLNIKEKVCVFDLDGTLSTLNSTFDFLRLYYFSNKKFFRSLLVIITGLRFIGPLIIRIFGTYKQFNDTNYARIYLLTKGLKEKELDRYVPMYWQEFKKSKTNLCILIDALLKKGKKIIIATSCPSLPAKYIAKEFNIKDIVCSEYELVQGELTGRLSVKTAQKKSKLLKRYIGKNKLVYFSDEIEDDMLKYSSKYYLFRHGEIKCIK